MVPLTLLWLTYIGREIIASLMPCFAVCRVAPAIQPARGRVCVCMPRHTLACIEQIIAICRRCCAVGRRGGRAGTLAWLLRSTIGDYARPLAVCIAVLRVVTTAALAVRRASWRLCSCCAPCCRSRWRRQARRRQGRPCICVGKRQRRRQPCIASRPPPLVPRRCGQQPQRRLAQLPLLAIRVAVQACR